MYKKLSLLLTGTLLVGGIFTGCGAKQEAGKTEAATETKAEATKAAEPTATPELTKAAEPTATPEPTKAAEKVELVVFAAASMTETLGEIKGLYEKEHPEVTITYNFDSSGTLKTQIEEGAPCDAFISAGQKQMNQLDKEADPEVNKDGLDFVDSSTRFNILENKVTLCVSETSKTAITNFDSMAEALKANAILLCMGNEDVPVGQYTQKILAYYGLDEAALAAAGCITYGSNVKEVTTQIKEGSVDCGVIYCTDAYSAGLTPSDYATKEMCGQVIYPAAVMKKSNNAAAAKAYLDFLKTDACSAIFEKVGFTAIK